MVGIGALLALPAPWSVAPLSAQSAGAQPGAAPNRCTLASSEARAGGAPEGEIVLRMQRELTSAAQSLQDARAAQGPPIIRLREAQRQLDSLREALRAGPGARTTIMLRALQPEVAALTDVAEAKLPARISATSGYLGVTLSGAQLRTVEATGVLTSHCRYPLVESVEAQSPAEQAGIRAGDTLVAYNGVDLMAWAVNYTELLAPGGTVRVRVRRGGPPRELPVAVAPRPRPPLPVRSDLTSAMVALGGAQFVALDAPVAATLSVEAGVLALRVPPGTPAADAGLRGGDMVLRVNEAPVRELGDLRRTLLSAGREVRLVVRGRGTPERTVVVTLRP